MEYLTHPITPVQRRNAPPVTWKSVRKEAAELAKTTIKCIALYTIAAGSAIGLGILILS